MAMCPVCVATGGMEAPIDKTKAEQQGLTTEYQGRTYYFDREEHKRMFMEDPERYLQMLRDKGYSYDQIAA